MNEYDRSHQNVYSKYIFDDFVEFANKFQNIPYFMDIYEEKQEQNAILTPEEIEILAFF